MPRGNYWEMTYDPDVTTPFEEAILTLDGTTGQRRRRIVSAAGGAISPKLGRTSPVVQFEQCDVLLTVRNATISNWSFVACRFEGSVFENVKFSNCRFVRCHFSRVSFSSCYFVDTCAFDGNSASAELLKITDTAISATRFLAALTTNTQHLPPETNVAYQMYRFARTREKIAKLVFSSTRNEGDLGYFCEAYRGLVLAALDCRVERHRFKVDSPKSCRNKFEFVVRSIPSRAERRLIIWAGWLTDWGATLIRYALHQTHLGAGSKLKTCRSETRFQRGEYVEGFGGGEVAATACGAGS